MAGVGGGGGINRVNKIQKNFQQQRVCCTKEMKFVHVADVSCLVS